MQELLSYSLNTLKCTEKELHKRGLIPGPKEEESSFCERIWNLQEQTISLPCVLFGLEVNWVAVTFSKKGLHFLEGAATFVSKEGSLHVQLHPRFEKGYFWIYSLEEVLAHEAVHAARREFNEPEFEEILAYQTAKSRFRRFFGPLFRSSLEIGIAMGSLFFSLLRIEILGVIPCVVFGYFIFRLIRLQRIFSQCKSKLKLSTLLYLTDQEIHLFSNMKEEEILSYLKQSNQLRCSIAYAMQTKEA